MTRKMIHSRTVKNIIKKNKKSDMSGSLGGDPCKCRELRDRCRKFIILFANGVFISRIHLLVV